MHTVQGRRRDLLRVARPARAFWTAALSILALDQVSKSLVRAELHPGQLTGLVPGVLDLTYVRNTGAAFGLFPGRQPVFILTSVVVLVVIAAYWRRDRPSDWPVVFGTAAIAGGAVGNLVDRALVGRVTDFLAFAFIDFPVFNIADIGIVGGVAVLVLWLLFGPEPGSVEAVAEVAADQDHSREDVDES